MSLFGNVITDDQVEDAVMATLVRWLDTDLKEVERQVGLAAGYYQRPAPQSYFVRNDFEKWPEEMLPAIIVISTGLADDPRREGNMTYRVPFAIGVGCVVSSMDQLESRRYAYRMGAAVRLALLQHQSLDQALGGKVRGVDWLDGRNNEMPPDGDRTIWATRQVFRVEVADVVTKNAGPRTPDPPDTPVDHADWPLADPVTVTTTKENIT